jgi:lysyl oxidase/Big-like domain-containing protein
VLLVVVAALVGLFGLHPAQAAAATEVLPDLVADAPERPLVQTYAHADGTTHLLLRFDGFVHNRGLGAFEMRGSQRVGTDMTLTVQRVYRDDATFFDDPSRDPPIIWEPEDGHAHWHLMNAARYSLWSSDQTAQVAPAMKVGFCLVDLQRIETHGPTSPRYTTSGNNFCGQNQPSATSVFEGVSAGWRDVYSRTLAFQWVDVTHVQPGSYWLRSDVDPDDYVRESNEVNASVFATASSTIPGYRAKPVNAGVVSMTAPTTIPLATDSYGTGLGARAFRVIVSPKHGRLNVGGGSLFSTPSVTYTPNPGWVGPDSFTYEAHDSASSFPPFPATAAVTLNVGGVSPNVAISGAPASLLAGTSARLLATVLGEDPYVNWTVDGVDSGTPETGTVDSWGLYQAPAQAPPAGQVTIRATTASGAFDEVTIAITDPPPAQPAPTTEAQLAASSVPSSAPLGATASPFALRLTRDREAVIAGVRSSRAGVIRVRVRKGSRLLGRCRVRMPRGRALSCRAGLPRGVSAGRIRAVASLRVAGALKEVARASLVVVSHHAHHHGG